MTGITPKDYDDRVAAQGLQFQADNYYEPRDPAMARRVDTVARAIDPRPPEKILDVGCGVGTFAYQCARSGGLAIGIDYSFESIRAAIELCARYGVRDNSRFLVADASELPFKAGYFDKAVAADFIEHITYEGKARLLAEIKRVLKPGGRAIIFTPNKIREDIGHIYRKMRHVLFNEKVPSTELHFGLTARREFEKLCVKEGFGLRAFYEDTTRPYLAKVPVLRGMFALNLLWVLTKK